MRNTAVFIGFFIYCSMASAQWAVLDEEVRKLLDKINKVSGPSKTLTAFDAQALLSEKFETKLAPDPAKYVGTLADCGDQTLNLNHYNACLGLRNLRLKTLEQTEAIVEKIKKRRDDIKKVVQDSSSVVDAGAMQRLQFELQGLQTHLQNDAMELDALRYGYKQREHMYEMQMAESRRASDTRPASGAAGGGISFGPVKFNVVK